MKSLVYILTGVFVMTLHVWAVCPSDELMNAIRWVESRDGQDVRDGDGGKSVGPYQIQQRYLDDANAWAGTHFLLAEMRNKAKAEFVVWSYLDRWGTYYQRKTGCYPTAEVLARIHNGGPFGWRKLSTKPYWRRVFKRMKEKEGSTR